MGTRKGMEVTTTVSFQVTFVLPKGVTIPDALQIMKDSLYASVLHLPEDQVKVHLVNKEMKYGKR